MRRRREGGGGGLHVVVWVAVDIALEEELHPLGAGETRRKVDCLGVGGHVGGFFAPRKWEDVVEGNCPAQTVPSYAA